ncbi:MAG: hypothetical protein D6778_03345 [Nitrospirae bacterium]|nr:MAG: hypothetical protein D6778_03345 [Nitrospirota bacterium]
MNRKLLTDFSQKSWAQISEIFGNHGLPKRRNTLAGGAGEDIKFCDTSSAVNKVTTFVFN